MDESLLRLANEAREGDPRALNLLLEGLRPTLAVYMIRRFAARVADAGLIDDLVQEGLIRIARRLPECRATEAAGVGAWIMKTARSAAIDFLRCDRRENEGLGEYRLSVRASGEPAAAAPLTDRELLLAYVVADREVPEATRQMLILHVIGQWEWEEVGLAFDLPPTAAKRRVQRATARVKKAMIRELELLPEEKREGLRRRFGL